MPYNIVVLGWVIGFVSATVLTIGITIRQTYKKYMEEQKFIAKELADKITKEPTGIEKWKRKVYRP
jgi:hypothetical protein